jgi:YD repeat-containing protein
VIDPIGHTTTHAYEATGLRNHTSVTAPNSQSTTFAHDAWGRDTLVKDPKLATWRQGYDILNRVAWTLSPLVGDTTKFQYDSLDNVTKVTDAKGQTFATIRNALNWVVKQIDPIGHADSAAYDSAGRVVYSKSRGQRVVTLQYDALGRVTQQIGAGGSDVVTFTYDLNHRWVAARSVTGGTLVTTDTIFHRFGGPHHRRSELSSRRLLVERTHWVPVRQTRAGESERAQVRSDQRWADQYGELDELLVRQRATIVTDPASARQFRLHLQR